MAKTKRVRRTITRVYQSTPGVERQIWGIVAHLQGGIPDFRVPKSMAIRWAICQATKMFKIRPMDPPPAGNPDFRARSQKEAPHEPGTANDALPPDPEEGDDLLDLADRCV